MPSFGTTSRRNLELVDPRLVGVLNEAIKSVDFSVVWGHRSMEAQQRAFREGKSRLQWPSSKHNKMPAQAVDIIPYPGGWDAPWEQWFEMATYVLAAAAAQGVRIRWGGHWKNYSGHGEYDRDWAHFEIF